MLPMMIVMVKILTVAKSASMSLKKCLASHNFQRSTTL